MTDDSPADPSVISTELLRGMAAAAGVMLTAEQAAALVPQAEQHFAQLGLLDAIADASTEPAGELHLDRWATPGSD